MASQTERGSLKATHRAAERKREAIETGAVRYSPADPDAYGDTVRGAIAAYEKCDRLVAQLALFSTNESAEDIATGHLPYLLVPFCIAELALKIPAYSSTSTPASRPAERRAVLARAREAYERYLHHLDGYSLLAANYVRLLQAYTEDPKAFSTVGSVSGSSTGIGAGRPPKAGLAGLADPTARRNAKIANFQAEKELRGKLDVLKQRQQQRREIKRRRKIRIREAEEGTADNAGSTEDAHNDEADNNDEDDDDDEDDDEDEEEARKLYMAQIGYSVHMAFQGLDGINVEDDMLANAPAPQSNGSVRGGSGSTAGGLGDNRQRSGRGIDDALSERIDQLGLHNGASLQRLQESLGAGAPTWAGTRGGPLLTKEGRPKQPFTITAGSNMGIGNNRAQMAKNVFRPGHNLPTMSIDEYLDEEFRRGNVIEGGGAQSGLAPEPDEDNYEKGDAETMKARAWDEFTESNAKGSGNTLNRG